jgi:hypothetical protein
LVNTSITAARKYLLAFAAGALVVGAVAGASGFALAQTSRVTDGTGSKPYLTADAVQQATDRSESTFPEPLPEGVAWPVAAPTAMTAKNVKVDPGVPRATTSFYWLCAWEDAYMKALHRGDQSAAAASLSTAERFRSLPFFKEDYDDPNNLWYTNVIEAARNGDSSGIEADLAQCTYFYESQPTK